MWMWLLLRLMQCRAVRSSLFIIVFFSVFLCAAAARCGHQILKDSIHILNEKKVEKHEITFWVQWLSITSRLTMVQVNYRMLPTMDQITADCMQCWLPIARKQSWTDEWTCWRTTTDSNWAHIVAAEMLHWPSETLGCEHALHRITQCTVFDNNHTSSNVNLLTLVSVDCSLLAICWHCCQWVACCAMHRVQQNYDKRTAVSDMQNAAFMCIARTWLYSLYGVWLWHMRSDAWIIVNGIIAFSLWRWVYDYISRHERAILESPSDFEVCIRTYRTLHRTKVTQGDEIKFRHGLSGCETLDVTHDELISARWASWWMKLNLWMHWLWWNFWITHHCSTVRLK